jgi:hypothetical protein
MANIVWPDNLCPRTFSLQLLADVRTSASVYGGSEIVNDLADDTWAVSMEIDSRNGDTAASLEALVNYLQGGIHTAEFGHLARPKIELVQGVEFIRNSPATYMQGGLLRYAAVNELRYQNGVKLLETAATNLLTYSEDFSNDAWTKKVIAPLVVSIDDKVVSFDNKTVTFE